VLEAFWNRTAVALLLLAVRLPVVKISTPIVEAAEAVLTKAKEKTIDQTARKEINFFILKL